MSGYYKLVDSYVDEEGVLIDVYEHTETDKRFEQVVGEAK